VQKCLGPQSWLSYDHTYYTYKSFPLLKVFLTYIYSTLFIEQYAYYSVADPGFAKGEGADHGERAQPQSKRGSEGGAPSGVQEQSPWWGSKGRNLLKLKVFLYIFMQKVAKT